MAALALARRPALKKLVDMSTNLADPATAKAFAELFYGYKMVFDSHAAYEEGVLFPTAEEVFPGVTEVVQHDHMRETAQIQVQLSCAGSRYVNNPVMFIVVCMRRS